MANLEYPCEQIYTVQRYTTIMIIYHMYTIPDITIKFYLIDASTINKQTQ